MPTTPSASLRPSSSTRVSLRAEARAFIRDQGRLRGRGQHFLVDEPRLEALTALCAERPTPWTAEIGAGLGCLTERLAGRPGLFVFEVDERLAARLAAAHPGLEIRGDARAWQPSSEAPDGLLAANLPYALSGAALGWLAASPSRFAGAVLMLQREVADRVTAQVGTRTYGLLSGPLRASFGVRAAMRLPPGSFLPPPKVESAVLVLDRRAAPPGDKVAAAYLALAKAAFSQRRKKARTLLRGLLDEETLGRIPEGARAEDIGPELGLWLARRMP